jgi:hypothetical protein
MTSNMKKTVTAILLLGAVVITTVGITSKRKFWGTATRTRDWADGKCTYRETCVTRYVFWISRGENCTTTTINCP